MRGVLFDAPWMLTALLAVGCTAPEPDPADAPPVDDDDVEIVDVDVALELTDNPHSTLAAYASVDVAEAAAVALQIEHPELGSLKTPWSPTAEHHDLDVLGLRPDEDYTVRAIAQFADGTVAFSDRWPWSTGSLPDGLPELSVEIGDGAQGGITLLSPSMPRNSDAEYEGPYAFGVDREGEVVWYLPADLFDNPRPSRPFRLLEDGNLQFVVANSVRVVTPAGEVVQEVVKEDGDGWRIHHDATPAPGGRFAVLDRAIEQHHIDHFGGSVEVVGDVLTELDGDGEVTWQWSMFDHLDLQRWPGEMAQESIEHGDNNTAEWTHSNSIEWMQDEGALLVSMRHQNQLVSVDRDSGDVNWLFGADGDFELLSGQWFSSQHAASRPEPDRLLLFDNANEAEFGDDHHHVASRAVAYRVDWANGTADEVWSFAVHTDIDTHGSARQLRDGHVLVGAAGGRDAGEPAVVTEVDAWGEAVWSLELPSELLLSDAHRVDWALPVDRE